MESNETVRRRRSRGTAVGARCRSASRTACATCTSAATRSRAACASRAPDELVLSYTRSMLAFCCSCRCRGAWCNVGLGGGSLAKWIHRHLPEAQQVVLELDPRVIARARGAIFTFRPTIRGCGSSRADGASPGCAASGLLRRRSWWTATTGARRRRELATPRVLRRRAPRCCEAARRAGREPVGQRSPIRLSICRASRRLRRADLLRAGGAARQCHRDGVQATGRRARAGTSCAQRADRLEAAYGLEFGEFVGALKRLNRPRRDAAVYLAPWLRAGSAGARRAVRSAARFMKESLQQQVIG